jgi:6-pyruvoyltetrahydropterin/6-carboxytetrahydropterin synthase
MPTTIEHDYVIAAAHRLPHVHDGHQCGRMHGHNYTITLVCTGEVDPNLGWIFDFAALTDAWTVYVHAALDHRTLNDVIGLSNPTSENLAWWIFNRMEVPVAELAPTARLVRVVVAEKDRSRVTYEP